MNYTLTSKQETDNELQQISYRTEYEVATIQKVYKKEIVASTAFGYISMAFMIALPVTIILNDLGKLHHKRSFERLMKRVQKLRAFRNQVGVNKDRRDGLKMCESISKSRATISDFDSLFLKSLVNMHAKVSKKKSF